MPVVSKIPHVTLLGEQVRSNTTDLTLLKVNLAFPHLIWAIGLSLLLACWRALPLSLA